MLYTVLLRYFHNGGNTHISLAQHYIGFYVCMSVLAIGCSGLAIFQVHQGKSTRIFFEQGHRILAGLFDPEDIHFKIDICRIGFSKQVIKQVTVFPSAKFITMGMVAKVKAILFQDLSCSVKDLYGLAGIV